MAFPVVWATILSEHVCLSSKRSSLSLVELPCSRFELLVTLNQSWSFLLLLLKNDVGIQV